MGDRVRIGVTVLVAGAAVAALPAKAAATFPGANGKIAFGRFVGEGGGSLFTMDADGQNQAPLTSSTICRHPSFSGDGERIAFSCATGPSTASSEILVMDADGQNQVPLTSNAVEDLDPSFSPDGQRIIFTRFQAGDGDIFAIDADGQNEVPLTDNTSFEGVATFSPDGKTIAFVRSDGSDDEIFIMDANGQNQVPLTANAVNDGGPNFSPDGETIVFSRGSAGPTELFLMDANGQNQFPLTNSALAEFTPAFSPDGQRIVFAGYDGSSQNLYTVDANGQNQIQLTTTSGFESDSQPNWQPLNPPAIDVTAGKQKSPKKVTVTVVSQNENATATLDGTLKAPKAPKVAASKSKTVELDEVSVQLQPGVPVTVEIPVAGNGKKLLKKSLKAGKRPKGTITASATDDLGGSASATLDVKYKKKKKK